MVDKKFCMSSYLTFRCIVKDDVEFAEGLHHSKDIAYPDEKKIAVRTAEDIAKAYKKLFEEKENDVKAFVTVLKDEALKQAEETDKKIQDGQATGNFVGVPIGIKDNICTKGIKTTM